MIRRLRLGILTGLLLLGVSAPAWAGSTTLHSAAVADADGKNIAVADKGMVGLAITISGTATVTPKGSNDGGVTWTTFSCLALAGGASSSAITATGQYLCAVSGMTHFEAPLSGCSGCTVTVMAHASQTNGLGAGLTFDASGNVSFTLGTLLACEDQTNNLCMTRERPFATYSVANTFTPPATPTDMITITGSATTSVKVWSVQVCTTNTAAGSQEFRLIKRSTADTGGTAVASTLVPHSTSSPAATAVVNHYTANPGALGTAVGTLNIVRWASPVLIPGSFAGVVESACRELLPTAPNGQAVQAIELYGVAQQLAVNFNGAALVAGQVHAFRVTVSEE